MLFGAHVSIARGLENAPENAQAIGCQVFQMFTRPPQGGRSVIAENNIKEFLGKCQDYDFTDYYIHAPYYINLASINKRIYHGSISAIRQELEVGSKIKAKYVMFHPGSAKDVSAQKGIKMVAEGIKEILKGYKGKTELLIENSAGAGNVVGDQFEEIAEIFNLVKSSKLSGICLDTAHSFASGYDWRNKTAVAKTLKEFDKILGLSKLKMLHGNDSKAALGSHRDRHAHIGYGEIGKEGFWAIVNHPKLKKVNLVLETPQDELGGYEIDLAVLKKMRTK